MKEVLRGAKKEGGGMRKLSIHEMRECVGGGLGIAKKMTITMEKIVSPKLAIAKKMVP